MDDESDYNIGLPPTEPSTPEEIISIESLIKRVEEFQKRDRLDTLEKLTAKNSFLQTQIRRYQREWYVTIDLLLKTHDSLLRMQNALGKCFQEQIGAEKNWLAFWGIKRDSSCFSPAGWI
jgi:hypothetical protein